MSSNADMNVRLGFIDENLRKGIRQAEKELQRAGRTLNDAGNKLALSVSLPLLAIGTAAIKAAGDMEALKLAMRGTFEGAGRSMEAADAELEKLRESAKAPGLDFEQAVKASIRFQAVEFSAEEARKTVEQLANTIATTGGTAQNLEGVTVQMAQMISKGKVLSQDLRIMQENMPVLSKLMKQAFGTSNAEELQKMGITGKEFVEKITAEMEKLPRVSGGIANAIVNAGNAVTQFLASVGDTLNKTFNVTGKLDAFSGFLEGIGKGFREMNEGTRTAVAGVAVFALTIGPAIKVGNILIQMLGAMQIAWKSMTATFQAWLLVSQNPEAKTGLISWFKNLDRATKLTTFGAIIGIALAAAAAFALLSKDMSAAAQAARTVEQVNRTAADSIVEERLRAESLIAVLKDQNATREQQKSALNELKAISPEYFGRLDLEKTKVEDLDKALGDYVGSLLRAAKAQAAFEQIKELEKTKNNVEELADPSIWQNIQNGAVSVVDIFQRFGNLSGLIKEGIGAVQGAEDAFNPLIAAGDRYASQFQSNKDKIVSSADAQIAALQEVIKANSEFGSSSKKSFGGSSEEAQKMAKTYKEILSDIANVSARQDLLGSERVVEQAQAIENGIKKLLDVGFKPASKEVQNLKTQLQGLFTGIKGPEVPQIGTLPTPTEVTQQTPFDEKKFVSGLAIAQAAMVNYKSVAEQVGEINLNFQGGLIGFGEAFAEMAKIVSENSTLIQTAFFGIAESATAFAEAGGSSISGFVNALVEGAKKAVGAYIRIGVAAVVSKALAAGGFNPFLALATGAIAGAAAQTLFNKLLSGIKIPEFAGGTKFAPGGLSLVGERGPELVSLPRGSQVTPNAATNRLLSGGGDNLVLSHRISGSDLLFIVERAQAQSKRIRGF